MARLWAWGALSTNPFIDFTTTWIEPLIQHLVDVLHRIEPDLQFTLAYLAVIGTAYLFHSPFRAHSTAATDTYGRITKVFQTWSTVVFFCFHLGPQFFQSKRSQIALASDGDDLGPFLYFPLFAAFNIFFAFSHKMKRRWGLGLTYGGRLSVIGLNSLILAALGTVHYAYCSTLYESSSNRFVKAFFYSLTPAPVGLHPYRCITKLLFLSACFIAGDYQYKRWMGFDPSRGILWGELYELRKHGLDTTQSTENTDKDEKRDWRECVAPPRVYAPSTLAATSPAHLQNAFNQSALSSGAPSYRASNPVAPAKARVSPDEASPMLLRPRVLYHECPPDMNMEQIASWFDVDDAALQRVCGGCAKTASRTTPSTTSPPPQGSRVAMTEGPEDTAMSAATTTTAVPPAEALLTRLTSFRAPRFFVREAVEAKHPVNRPGMVPWWSTFVLFTAWQTVAGATLRFLAFDVRTIQGFTTPKVFHLHFDTSLKRSAASAARCDGRLGPTMLRSAARAAPAGEQTSMTESSPSESATKLADQQDSDASATMSNTDAPAAGAAPPKTAPDVWFDWIADVGDGFNPTYALARLLAQPALHLPLASGKSARWPRRTSVDTRAGRAAHSVGSSTVRPVVKTASSAPTTPRRHPSATATPFLSPSSPFTADSMHDREDESCSINNHAATPTVTLHKVRSAFSGDNVSVGEEGSRRVYSASPDTPLPLLPSALRVASPDATTASATSLLSDNAEATYDYNDESTRSREAVSASFALRAPRRHTTAHHTHQPKTAASRALLGVERDGMATLPRGSFVVVGGDLAYPSPDDDTYTTRLFEPYNDALGGNIRLQNLFHAEQQRIVVADRHDVDVAHLHMLDATTVSDIATGRGGLGAGRGSAEEALRSLPLLFAIPGNHDWFDGLTTYRKYILERTWIGGWLMPQRSSFFVLRLPHNWFMLCGDTGNTQDIDVSQRNYFLDVIERYMDAESCVILSVHEPGWLFDAMERDEKPRQPEVNRVVEALGTRLRLRLAGDIHNYSRHVPTDPSSEAATLVVSGGGGAFLHGARNDRIIAQGTHYVRACAFPSRTTFTNMAARLWGFRVVNWKFDMVVGFLCFVILLSVLPLPVETELRTASVSAASAQPVGVAQVFSLWVAYATKITSHVCTKGIISIFPILFFWMCFATAGSDRHASLRWRLCYGAAWTFAVTLSCSAAMAFIHVQILYLMDNGFLYSSEGQWTSVMETQTKVLAETFTRHAWQLLGGEQHHVARGFGAMKDFIASTKPMGWMLVVVRCLDPFETFGFLSTKASSGTMGVFADDVSRLQILIYYVYVLFFYWIVITPIVSMLIGTFLLISVTSFDYMYDGTYSAFQIEDYKHFIRFRIDAATRQLHAYVIAVQKPAKVYEVDRKFVWSLTGQGLEEHRPPHLKHHPSRWAPMESEKRRKKAAAEVLEHFTVHPHRVPQPS